MSWTETFPYHTKRPEQYDAEFQRKRAHHARILNTFQPQSHFHATLATRQQLSELQDSKLDGSDGQEDLTAGRTFLKVDAGNAQLTGRTPHELCPDYVEQGEYPVGSITTPIHNALVHSYAETLISNIQKPEETRYPFPPEILDNAATPKDMPFGFFKPGTQNHHQHGSANPHLTRAVVLPPRSIAHTQPQHLYPLYHEIGGDPFAKGKPLDPTMSTVSFQVGNCDGVVSTPVPAHYLQSDIRNVIFGGVGVRSQAEVVKWLKTGKYPPRNYNQVKMFTTYQVLVPGRGLKTGPRVTEFVARRVSTLAQLKNATMVEWKQQFEDLGLSHPKQDIHFDHVTVEALPTHSTADYLTYRPLKSADEYNDWFDTHVICGRAVEVFVRITHADRSLAQEAVNSRAGVVNGADKEEDFGDDIEDFAPPGFHDSDKDENAMDMG